MAGCLAAASLSLLAWPADALAQAAPTGSAGPSTHQSSGPQYRWKDARGQLHASDLPPPADVPEQNILSRPGGRRSAAAVPPGPRVARAAGGAPAVAGPAASAAGAASGAGRGAEGAGAGIDPELEKRRQRAEQEARLRAEADAQRQALQRRDNCQRARAQLALVDSGQRLFRVNAAGEREPMDDGARAQEAAVARQVIASECR